LVEQAPPCGRQLVRALGGPWLPGFPSRRDEPVLLERAQDPVEVAHVDARLARQRRQRLEQLVAVRRALAEEEQQRGLAEARDSCAHGPVAGTHHPTTARSALAARPHAAPTGKTHMKMTLPRAQR